jgi:site-specific DNA-methyltransferase (adenine-specific)
LRAFGEPGAIVYLADCVDLMKIIPSGSVDVVFADPPYRLSRGGVTVKSGRLAPVDKGDWDRSVGFDRIESLPISASASLVSSIDPSG